MRFSDGIVTGAADGRGGDSLRAMPPKYFSINERAIVDDTSPLIDRIALLGT
jgi:hypothetical protein